MLLVILIALVIWLIVANIRIVPQGQAYVIESLGKYYTTWEAGLRLKIPILQRIAKKVSLKEQVLDFPPQPVITKDNVTISIDSVVFAKVFDPRLYTYGAENPIAGLQNLSATTLRNIIGEMELDQTLTSRDQINKKLESILDEATDAWGIKVTRVELKNIMPPKEIEEVMSKQMRAERERRQTVLEAQAHKEAVVSRAEGDQRAKILAAEAERDAQIALAEGRAKSIRLVYEAEADGLRHLEAAGVGESVLKLKGLEALKDVADGRATKIYMPSDITSAVSSLGLVGEALGIGDSTPIDKTEKSKVTELKQEPPAAKKKTVFTAPPEKEYESPFQIPIGEDPCIKDKTSKGGKEAEKTTRKINEDLFEVSSKMADRDDVSPKRKHIRFDNSHYAE